MSTDIDVTPEDRQRIASLTAELVRLCMQESGFVAASSLAVGLASLMAALRANSDQIEALLDLIKNTHAEMRAMREAGVKAHEVRQ